jgi:hypothetical protein
VDAASARTDQAVDESRPWLIEARYFAGGLETRELPAGLVRPAWVPPSDYVGFRNEFQLGQADCVVEVARFAYAGQRVSWIAVYGRSPDAVHGDRGNLAGTGVWLRDHDVQAADALLHGLRLINALVVDRKIGEASHGAAQFNDADYLPKYVRRSGRLAPSLSGWAYSDSQLPATSLYLALASDEAEAWALASEQVDRISLLPGPSPRHSRAMVLVRVGSGGVAQAAGDAQPLRSTLARDLVARLPDAFDEERAQSSAERSELELLRQRSSALETTVLELRHQLAEATAHLQEALQRAAALEAQVSEDDLRLRLASIEQLLRSVGARSERAESQLHTLGRRLELMKNPPTFPPPPLPPNPGDGHETGPAGRTALFRRYATYIWLVIGLVAGVAIAGSLYWAVYDNAPVPRSDDIRDDSLLR